MFLFKLIAALSLVLGCCAVSEQLNCLRNGICPNVCPRGFNGGLDCSSCTDDRLSESSDCTECDCEDGDCQMGNFTLSVMFHSYLNPSSLCGECRLPEYGVGPVCCDTFNQTENCPSHCEFRFAIVVEAYGEPLRNITLPAGRPDFNLDNITSFPVGPDAFNVSKVSNPFTMQLNTWTERFQIYIVVYDVYRPNNTPTRGRFAVDRFPINVTLGEVPSNLCRQTYHGIYGIAQFDLSFEIQSNDSFTSDCPTTTTTTITISSGMADTPTDGDTLPVTLETSPDSLTPLVGGVIGAIVGVALVSLLCFILLFLLCRQRRRKRAEYLTDAVSPDPAGAIAIKDLDNPVYDTEKDSTKIKDTGMAKNFGNPVYDKEAGSAKIGTKEEVYSEPTAKGNGDTPHIKGKGEEREFQNSIYGHDLVRNDYSQPQVEGGASSNANVALNSRQINGAASAGGALYSTITEDQYDSADVAIPGRYEMSGTPGTSKQNMNNGGQAKLMPGGHYDMARPSSDLYDMPGLPNNQYETARAPSSDRYDVTHAPSEQQAKLPTGPYDVAHQPTDMYDVAHAPNPNEHVQAAGPSEDYDVAHPPGTQQQYDDIVLTQKKTGTQYANASQQPGEQYDDVLVPKSNNQYDVTHKTPSPINSHLLLNDDQYDVAHPPPTSSNNRPVQYDDIVVQPPGDQYDVAHRISPPRNKQPQFDNAQYDVAHPQPTIDFYDVAHPPPPSAATGTRYETVDGIDYDVANAPTSRSSSAGMNHLEDNPRYESSDLPNVNNGYSVANGLLKPSGHTDNQYSVIHPN